MKTFFPPKSAPIETEEEVSSQVKNKNKEM